MRRKREGEKKKQIDLQFICAVTSIMAFTMTITSLVFSVVAFVIALLK